MTSPDRGSDTAAQLRRHIAAAGGSITMTCLRARADLPEPVLRSGLRELERRDVIHVTPGYWTVRVQFVSNTSSTAKDD